MNRKNTINENIFWTILRSEQNHTKKYGEQNLFLNNLKMNIKNEVEQKIFLNGSKNETKKASEQNDFLTILIFELI